MLLVAAQWMNKSYNCNKEGFNLKHLETCSKKIFIYKMIDKIR